MDDCAGMQVSDIVRNKAAAAGAGAWLDDLPELVADLEREWSIAVGRAYPGGTEAFVAEATLVDGTPAVLKLLVPAAGAALAADDDLARAPLRRDAAANEIRVLRLADGQGCAQLLRDDAARGAMLLERLGPSLFDLAVPLGARHEILASAASRLWRPAPDAGLPTGAEKGEWLGQFIATSWEELDRPCSERVIEHAIACAQRRVAAHDDERAVLVHGDVHQWNALQAGDGFKLIDPDGLLAEPEYDLGVIMREDPLELLHGDPHDRARWLAARTGLDATAIWEWGVVARVSSGLLCAKLELQPFGDQTLAAAERVAGL